jgi:bifunctional DNA-binding transcriptional regulator/antitoxin component of YhaV-PrlF toxin-antitoxin module
MVTTVTRKNQVSLPSALTAQAGILPGARLDWSLDPSGDLRARPLPSRQQAVKSLRGRGRHLLVNGQSPVAELITERTKELV